MSRDPTSRKPSESSTQSSTRSPSSPSNNPQPRNTTPTANMLTVNMANVNASNLKGLGWQGVWGATTPSSKRKPSGSSAASANDLVPPYGFGESWTSSRRNSGNWEDSSLPSPLKADVKQLDSQSPLNLRSARQRQAPTTSYSAQRIDDRAAAGKSSQYSPQRYEAALGIEPNPTRLVNSPSKPFASNLYLPPSGITAQGNPGYDPSSLDSQISLALRGMTVEDDYSSRQVQPQVPTPAMRPAPLINQQAVRPTYSNYSQDYSNYYSNPSARESYGDYPYAYDAYRAPVDYTSPAINNAVPGIYFTSNPQNVSLTAVTPLSPPSVYYDLSNSGSSYYYPAVYPSAPTTILNPPPVQGEKKRNYSQNVVYPSTHAPPQIPHHQHYTASLDYGQRLPMIMPGAIYSNPHNAVYPPTPHRRDGMGYGGMSLRSAVLDEFRANKTRKWDLKDTFGHVVEFSGDQHGSRFIQQKLETASSEEKQIIFDEIVPNNTLQLIQDVFGNYVIQKLFEHGTQVQKTQLSSAMEGYVLQLSLQMYGCRVVQKAVEFVLPEQQASFVKELEAHVLKCVKDANGNHVIQKIIERVSPERLDFIYSFRGHIYEMASHPYGCRVLQRCLEHLPPAMTRHVIDEVQHSAGNLMMDQFGNYVIQFVLAHAPAEDKSKIIRKLHGNFLQMARHKFASNVCEKALLAANADEKRLLIDEILYGKQGAPSPVHIMMKDQYANYVLQRAFEVADFDQREALINFIKLQLTTVKRYPGAYSKHMISIQKMLEKHANMTASHTD